MANEYALHIGPKTKFLNFFRRVFTIPAIENFLVRRLEQDPNIFFRKLIPPNYLYKTNSTRHVIIDGVKFILDISNVVEHLIYFRNEPEKFGLVNDEIGKAKIIFDVGANVGGTTLLFASKNPQARIFSFEPHPDTYQKAKTNIELNAFEKIYLFNKGVGAENESKKLYQVIDKNPGMNRILPGDHAYPFTLIETIKLDDFCHEHNIEHIDFLKIDVEGFEYFVLLGGKDIISKTHPVIYLELYDHGLKKNGYSASALISLLFAMGYTKILNAYTLTAITSSTDLTDCDIDIIAEKN